MILLTFRAGGSRVDDVNGGNVERGEDAGTVEEGIDFLAEGDLGGGREDVIDEGEGKIESCLWRGWGYVPTQRVNEGGGGGRTGI